MFLQHAPENLLFAYVHLGLGLLSTVAILWIACKLKRLGRTIQWVYMVLVGLAIGFESVIQLVLLIFSDIIPEPTPNILHVPFLILYPVITLWCIAEYREWLEVMSKFVKAAKELDRAQGGE